MLRSLLAGLARLFSPLGPGEFVLEYRPGRPPVVRGTIARAKVAGIVDFLAHDLRLTTRAVVRGRRGRGPVRVAVSGTMSGRDRQRARNFLIEHLR